MSLLQQRIIIVGSAASVLAFSVWAAWTRHRAASTATIFPTGEVLEAQRKRFGRELRYCNALRDRDREACLENRALETREAFLCAEIGDVGARDRCVYALVFAVGVSPPCQAIEDPHARVDCLAMAGGAFGDKNACKLLAQGRKKALADCKDDGARCKSFAAQHDALIRACPAIVDGDVARCALDESRTTCVTAIATRRRDASMCAVLGSGAEPCQRTVATIARDAKLCGPKDAPLSDDCRALLARRVGSLECNVSELECRGRKAVAGGGVAALCEGDARCALFVAYRLRRADVCSLVFQDDAHAACADLAR